MAEARDFLKGRKPGDPFKGYYYKVLTRQGKVYEKDLGEKTRQIANAMQGYNPDGTWTEVQE